MVNQFQGLFFFFLFFLHLWGEKKKSEPIGLQKSFAGAEKLFVKMRKPPLPPPGLLSLFKGVIHTMS